MFLYDHSSMYNFFNGTSSIQSSIGVVNRDWSWYFICCNTLGSHEAFINATSCTAAIQQHLDLECSLIIGSYDLTVDFKFILSWAFLKTLLFLSSINARIADWSFSVFSSTTVFSVALGFLCLGTQASSNRTAFSLEVVLMLLAILAAFLSFFSSSEISILGLALTAAITSFFFSVFCAFSTFSFFWSFC